MRKVMVLGLVVALCGYAFGEVKVTPITTKPAPATKPTATQAATVPAKLEPFLQVIDKMPESLRPEQGENNARAGLRHQWLGKACFDNTKVFSFTGKLKNVSAGSESVSVVIEFGPRTIFGVSFDSVIVMGDAVVDPAVAAGWKNGNEIILAGKPMGADPPEMDLKARKLTIRLQDASAKEPPAPKKTK